MLNRLCYKRPLCKDILSADSMQILSPSLTRMNNGKYAFVQTMTTGMMQKKEQRVLRNCSTGATPQHWTEQVQCFLPTRLRQILAKSEGNCDNSPVPANSAQKPIPQPSNTRLPAGGLGVTLRSQYRISTGTGYKQPKNLVHT